MERISAGRPRRQGAAKASPAPEIAPAPEPLIEEPAAEQEPTLEHEPVVPLATPEPVFAARVRPPAPGPPLPTSRRAIFYDVENASHPAHIARVIEHLAIDPLGGRTEFVAVGNWRVIGPDTARLLARQGAQLVHSAPSSGVKDWSDLRIAVSAGVWLAAARPGDVLEIVSDDRAFDAVGDVAAALGIAFRRLSYRALAGAPSVEPREVQAAGGSGRRRGRRGRRGGRAPASRRAETGRAAASRASIRSPRERGSHCAPRRARRCRRRAGPAVAERRCPARHAGPDAQGPGLQPTTRLAATRHAAPPDQGTDGEPNGHDHAGGRGGACGAHRGGGRRGARA